MSCKCLDVDRQFCLNICDDILTIKIRLTLQCSSISPNQCKPVADPPEARINLNNTKHNSAFNWNINWCYNLSIKLYFFWQCLLHGHCHYTLFFKNILDLTSLFSLISGNFETHFFINFLSFCLDIDPARSNYGQIYPIIAELWPECQSCIDICSVLARFGVPMSR